MKLKHRSQASAFDILDVLADLMHGGRHSRRTVVRAFCVSLPTADRWLEELRRRVPGVRSMRIGKTTWFEMIHKGSPDPCAGFVLGQHVPRKCDRCGLDFDDHPAAVRMRDEAISP